MREVERVGGDRRRSQLGRVAIDVAATVGYDQMSIGDIADAAGVVRRTFSRYFSDKQAAFEFGYREVSNELRAAVQGAYDGGTTPAERAEVCLETIAEFLAADPARAEALVIHGHAAGSAVADVHRETMRRMAVLIRRNAAELVPPDRDAWMLAETVAGGIYQVVHARVAQGEVRQLPGLVPAWAVVATAPYAVIAQSGAGVGEGKTVDVGEGMGSNGGAAAGRGPDPRAVVGSGCVGR